MPKKISLLEHVHLKQSIEEININPNENWKKLKREKYTSNDRGSGIKIVEKNCSKCHF
jgi:hypothetical protein